MSPYNSIVQIPIDKVKKTNSSLRQSARGASSRSGTGSHLKVENIRKSYKTKVPTVGHNILEDGNKRKSK